MKTNLEKIAASLEKAGLPEYRIVRLTDDRTGIMVNHDYTGLYPTLEAYEKHCKAARIAARYGAKSEKRGHGTATLIYSI